MRKSGMRPQVMNGDVKGKRHSSLNTPFKSHSSFYDLFKLIYRTSINEIYIQFKYCLDIVTY